jgi:hypothetical protein
MRLFFLMVVLTSISVMAQKQTGILDRHVSISFTNEKVSVILNRIGQQAGFSFSYNSSIISDDQVATITMADKSVREVLNELFRGSMNYKEKGNYLILTRVVARQSKASVTPLILSGYVENAFTRERIVDASIYEKKSVSAVLTDEFGFFRLRVDKRSDEPLLIFVSKKDYYDTTLLIAGETNQYFHVSLSPAAMPKTSPIQEVVQPVQQPDSASIVMDAETYADEGSAHEALVLPYESTPEVQNISDTLHRLMQFSLVPFIGTNGRMSGNVVNDYSVNLLGGYSMGTRYFELGGLFNIDRGNAAMLQIAGLANVNGADMSGVQVGGFFNLNGGKTNAVQVGGLSNVNFENTKGVVVAGLTNVNLASAQGVQVAGLVNFANGSSDGVQVAGLANVQIRDFYGPQIAGLTNITHGTVKGSQIAGLFNYGHKIYGTQIGFINRADSLTGIPIGFMSFVRHGYHKIELSADEVFYGNLAFRTGVRQFYNIIMAGIKADDELYPDVAWTFGYGVGTAPRLFKDWLSMNIDLTCQQLNVNEVPNSMSLLNKLHVGFDFQFASHVSLYAGATLNGYLTQASLATPFPGLPLPTTTNPNNYPLFSGYTPSFIYDDILGNDVRLRMWWGAKIALRFL